MSSRAIQQQRGHPHDEYHTICPFVRLAELIISGPSEQTGTYLYKQHAASAYTGPNIERGRGDNPQTGYPSDRPTRQRHQVENKCPNSTSQPTSHLGSDLFIHALVRLFPCLIPLSSCFASFPFVQYPFVSPQLSSSGAAPLRLNSTPSCKLELVSKTRTP